jgi:hypothetical protein
MTKKEKQEILKVIPTSWCDPMLTGKDAVICQPPYSCADIERVMWTIKKRLEEVVK